MSVKKPRLQNNPLSWMETKKVEIQGTRLSDVQHISPFKLKQNPLNSDFFREEGDDYFERLQNDIQERGIIVPLLAKKDDILLAGHNRLRVALKLGLETVPVQYVLDTLAESAEREFIIKDNLYRRQFSTAEWIHLYKKLYPDFDHQIQQETRGGGQKWAKAASKTEHSVLLGDESLPSTPQRLTAQKIADDTGQNLSAVQKQLTKYRKEKGALGTSEQVLNAKKKSLLDKQPTKPPKSTILEESVSFFLSLEKNVEQENPAVIRQIIKKIDALKQKLERLL
jgi:hypothetical protein